MFFFRYTSIYFYYRNVFLIIIVIDGVEEFIDSWETKRPTHNWEMDGCVVKVNSMKLQSVSLIILLILLLF